MRPVVIKDCNIFIDLELMGLTQLWLQLPYRTITTSLVTHELKSGGHRLSLALIESDEIEEHPVDSIALFELIEEHEGSGLSEADLSVLLAAEHFDAAVLSGDKALRTVATERHLEIHGTIWILDKMIEAEKLSPQVAADQLEYLLSLTGGARRFLPRSICHSRIQLWRKT